MIVKIKVEQERYNAMLDKIDGHTKLLSMVKINEEVKQVLFNDMNFIKKTIERGLKWD